MTKGSVGKKIFTFLIPILTGNFLQQLYTTADAIIIGNYTGKQGLASIDAIHALMKIPTVFFIGLSTGATILISRYYGSRDEKAQSKATHTALAFAAIGGIILSVLSLISLSNFLDLLAIPDTIYEHSLSYARIYFSGLAFVLLYNIGAGVLYAVGNSRVPLLALILSSSINIILDIAFIKYLNMHVSGAALATVISQAFSCFIILASLAKSTGASRLYLNKLKIHEGHLLPIMHLGLPIALQSVMYPLANTIIQSKINETGTDNIAAWSLTGKLDFLFWIVIEAFGITMATFSAQNHGANQKKRIKKGGYIALITSISIIAILSAILYFYGDVFADFFIRSEDHEIIDITIKIIRFIAPFYMYMAVAEVFSGMIKGSGNTLAPMLITLASTCVLRIVWILYILPENSNLFDVLIVYPISWVVNGILFTGYYYFFHKRCLE